MEGERLSILITGRPFNKKQSQVPPFPVHHLTHLPAVIPMVTSEWSGNIYHAPFLLSGALDLSTQPTKSLFSALYPAIERWGPSIHIRGPLEALSLPLQPTGW